MSMGPVRCSDTSAFKLSVVTWLVAVRVSHVVFLPNNVAVKLPAVAVIDVALSVVTLMVSNAPDAHAESFQLAGLAGCVSTSSALVVLIAMACATAALFCAHCVPFHVAL